MTSEHDKEKFIGHHLARKASNARRARLMITQQNKSSRHSISEFGGNLSLESRKFAFKNVVSSEGSAEPALKAAKLDSIVRNSSPAINLASHSQFKSLDQRYLNSAMNSVQIDENGENKKEKSSERVVSLKSGSASLMGRRRTMEDAMTVAPETIAGKYDFFAVYDGHGGDRVAKACSERLHKLVESELEVTKLDKPRGHEEASTSGGHVGSGNVVDWEKVMAASFCRMDDEVLLLGNERMGGEVGEEAVGSTAVVAMVGQDEVVVANCGDSRAVLYRDGVAMPLSDDHKPERPDERERVEAAGGKVLEWNGCRVQGVLSTSRSIGDHYLKPYVISEPEVTVTRRTESDEFLVIGSDGLWDVVTNELVCEIVRKCLQGRIRRSGSSCTLSIEDAATIIADLAIAKGSKDNISVIVVELKAKVVVFV